MFTCLEKSIHRSLLEQLLYKHASRLSGNIIDIGSKNRRYDSLFSGTITAVDLVPNAELKVVYGDVEKGLPFPDNSFDGAICIEIFQYLDNYMKAAEEIRRVLKPGGSIIVVMPLVYADHQDNIRFTKKFITEKLRPLFTSVEYHTFGNAYTVVGDILHRKIAPTRSRLLRGLIYLLALPYWLLLAIPGIKKITDDYYSGIFLIVTK